jgi:hypothetical protein
MAEISRGTSPPQDNRPAGINAGPAPARINWERLNIWFWRLLALAWLLNGLYAWAVIIGVDPSAARPFEARPPRYSPLTKGSSSLRVRSGPSARAMAARFRMPGPT